ncbi:hypothetical protein [Phytomonospora endophytica]|uniref:Uncharacterized protein n=1 Tax=Phytomonospora endophytica TaxID=714109 RepID=A0A841FQR2_9ACTN|nr:hypothetical protein [Phytomonospora endophytica]MBB6036128.1 hypothetical protein [Phytomonospora endophytica]GIG67031.1 hypothetical protein Pen01_33260 [Phytomonospora endophytica]
MTLRNRLYTAFAARPRPSALAQPEGGGTARLLGDGLAGRAVGDVTTDDVKGVFEGNLWALSPEALRYYLPALMDLALHRYREVSVFAAELLSALTEPSREDVVASLDAFERLPPAELRDPQIADALRRQQLEWFDSGTPTAVFHERFDGLTAAEGSAVLEFLTAFAAAHGENFPFGEVDAAVERYWARYGG